MNKVKTILNNIKEFTKEHKKAVIIAASVLVLSVLAIGGTVYMMNQNDAPKTTQTNNQAKETKKDDKKDNKQDKKNDQKKDDKKDSTHKDDKTSEKKNDVKETENKTETSNNSGNTNSTNNSTSTVKPSNNTTTNNTTTTTTKPSNTTSNNTSTATNNTSSNNSSNNSSSQPTGCTPVYETVTVTDVPAQPIYGEEQYLISPEEPTYQEKPVYMTSDGVAFEPSQFDELVDYCGDHNVSYYATTVKTQVGTKPAQYGTRQVVTGYTEPVTHTEQRQVDCR